MLPLLVWGNFTTEEKFVAEKKDKGEEPIFPASPGVFALQKPYEKVVCIISDNCPARYVNDSKGVPGATANIQIVQHYDPRTLSYEQSLHMLLQAQAIRDIEVDEQLFISYGALFWEEHLPINRTKIDEAELDDVGITGDIDPIESEDLELAEEPEENKSDSSFKKTF